MGVRADIAGHDAVAGQNLAQDGEGAFRAKSLVGRPHFLEHRGAAFGHRAEIPIIRDRFDDKHRGKRYADIADRIHCERIRLAVDVSRFHVEADESCGFRHPGFVIEFHRIVADSQHQIGLLMGEPDLVAEGVEEDSGIAGMVLGQHALGHRRQHDGYPVLLGEAVAQGRGIALKDQGRQEDAAAEFRAALEVCERLVREGRSELREQVATARNSLGNTLSGRLEEAVLLPWMRPMRDSTKWIAAR